MQEKALPDDNKDLTLLRTVVRWFAVGGVSVLMAGSFLFMGYEAIWGKPSPKNWILALVEKHFAALLGTPAAAATAFFVVTLLKVTSGPIEFEALSFTGLLGRLCSGFCVLVRLRLPFIFYGERLANLTLFVRSG